MEVRVLNQSVVMVILLGLLTAAPGGFAAEPAPDAGGLATFAGGCFWCMESALEKIPGVTAVISGYTGGAGADPGYQQVSRGGTGHAEAVQVHFDPDQISYEDLLQVFWRQIDPVDAGGQFVDRGDQYRSEIFFHDEKQRVAAEASRVLMDSSGRFKGPIVTAITPLGAFYPAEEYHQDFYKKNPGKYLAYRTGSGRDAFLDATWGEDRHYQVTQNGKPQPKRYVRPDEEALRSMLTPLQYRVTQEEGTEAAFNNEYWDNKKDGLYVDIVTGEPLFSSRDKFRSGTGWPSFTRPVNPDSIVEKEDTWLFMTRIEVRSRFGDSHLGHVFDDGPEPTGLRYCVNSAALRFIPVADLEKEGYGEYLPLFQ